MVKNKIDAIFFNLKTFFFFLFVFLVERGFTFFFLTLLFSFKNSHPSWKWFPKPCQRIIDKRRFCLKIRSLRRTHQSFVAFQFSKCNLKWAKHFELIIGTCLLSILSWQLEKQLCIDQIKYLGYNTTWKISYFKVTLYKGLI